ncbi:KOW domain-containing RNA-binding protein [Cohnella candidum]|uniref:KOW domain-containing RNA-binding protein n=1 Tax=Cohnella candidum TaxID=2674991 RepID=UPI001F1559A1|nr:KOW domain-containing RNA-binding protein [Cohnella candidum]
MTEWKNWNPGDIARSRRGKDEGQLCVVLALDGERFALVADGDKRRFDRPKRKNVLHLEPLGIHSEEVANSLRETGRVTNAKLRFAVSKAEMLAAETGSPSDAIPPARDAEEKGE